MRYLQGMVALTITTLPYFIDFGDSYGIQFLSILVPLIQGNICMIARPNDFNCDTCNIEIVEFFRNKFVSISKVYILC